MIKISDNPTIILLDTFTEREIEEVGLKGWYLAHIQVDDKTRYQILFYDPVRMMQEFNDSMIEGEPCFANFNVVLLPKVTVEAIQSSIQYLWRKGFFNFVKGDI